jgi:tetratricopeptide (TPR) repeat protein
MSASIPFFACTGLAAATLVCLQGCASSVSLAPPPLPDKLPDFIATQPADLQSNVTQLYAEGERNSVLNFDRLGVAALAAGQATLAAKAFDQAIIRIQSVRSGGKDIDVAKSKFGTESSKDFKGEPYEKAMAYYYRGIAYLHAGDFSNAAASFAQVNVEDSVAESETYQADYASAKLLQAWALHCTGEESTSADLYRQALEMRPELKSVDYQQPSLVIVETGQGPRKLGTGQYHERLTWTDGGGDAGGLVLTAGGVPVGDAVKSESLYYQASTRGGRPVEYLLAGKASFRDGAKTAADAGNLLAQAGLINANVQAQSGHFQSSINSSYFSLASTLFSAVSRAVEHSTTPAADTRAWDSLPGSLWLATPHVDAAAIDQVRVADADGGRLGVAPQVIGHAGTCSVAWTRLSPLPPLHRDAAEAIDSSSESIARRHQFQGALPNVL